MNAQIRPFDSATDLPDIAALFSQLEHPVTAEDLQRRLLNAPPGFVRQYGLAFDEQAALAGIVTILRPPWIRPGHYWARVLVEPEARRQGTGAALLDYALTFIRQCGATHADSDVSDDCTPCLLFALRHQFDIERYTFFSHLYLTDFDASRFTGVIETVAASGVRFATLAELGNTLENQRKLYDLNRLCNTDNPAHEGWGFEDFETFRARVFEDAEFRADAQIIALDGEQWIGLSCLTYYEEANAMYNRFTGVRPAYRGRHIALALKLLAIQCAQRYGIDYIVTNNDSENEPMLAINRRLGYQARSGIYRLLRKL
jgi:GNAT superfamily N-acetyltransferase